MNQLMTVIRQYVMPLLAAIIFSLALIAVSARIFLPSDMAAPAPIGITTGLTPSIDRVLDR